MRDRPGHRALPAPRRCGWRSAIGIATLMLAQVAFAGSAGTPSRGMDDVVAEAANAVRRNGCAGIPGARGTLRAEPRLHAVATQMLRGRALEDALAGADYPVVAATSIRIEVRGLAGDAAGGAMRNALARRFCAQLASAEYAELGVASDGRDAWLVLASPFTPPDPAQADVVTAHVLALVNSARSRGRQCGSARFDGAPALARSVVLDRTAMLHAQDLLVLGTLSHRGSDGGRVGDRIRRQGYTWARVAENLAAGATSAEQVVAGWFDSPAHCANLMGAGFTETGIAYVVSHEGAGEIYWVQVFAAP
jgi:uncharacterized protein YkwD